MRRSALILALFTGSCVGASGLAVAQDAGGGAGSTGPGVVDQQFVTAAVHANDAEIDQAQAELNAMSDPAVRTYAQRIIDDHSSANSQLAAIAKSLNLSFPSSHIAESSSDSTATPPPAASRPNPKSPMSPQAYMAEQVSDHQQAIALYENEARNGSSASLRTYAAETLPTLKAHLTMAQQYVTSGNISPVATPTPPGKQL